MPDLVLNEKNIFVTNEPDSLYFFSHIFTSFEWEHSNNTNLWTSFFCCAFGYRDLGFTYEDLWLDLQFSPNKALLSCNKILSDCCEQVVYSRRYGHLSRYELVFHVLCNNVTRAFNFLMNDLRFKFLDQRRDIHSGNKISFYAFILFPFKKIIWIVKFSKFNKMFV